MGRHCPGREWLVAQKGQLSLEYALVTVAVLSVILAFGAFVRFLQDGVFAQGVLGFLARRLPEGVLDILVF